MVNPYEATDAALAGIFEVTLGWRTFKNEWDANSITFENPIFPMKAFQSLCLSQLSQRHHIDRAEDMMMMMKKPDMVKKKKIELFFLTILSILMMLMRLMIRATLCSKRHISPG